MCHTCDGIAAMSKMIQVRNVPDRLHRALLRRARARKMSLTAYLQEVLEREAAATDADIVWDRLRSRTSVAFPLPIAQVVRESRDTRGGRHRSGARRLGSDRVCAAIAGG